jgi:hypothetical protein
MALLHYGIGVVGMSGSIAGTTFARNRAGNYARARTVPVNSRSSRQTAARLILAMLAEYWHESNMDDTKRGQWQAYALAIAWNNRFGDSMHLSGFNHFLRSNAARLAAGGVIIEDGPSALSLPLVPTDTVASGSESTQKLSIAFDNAQDWASEVGAFLSVEMGTPREPSRNFFNGPWRYAGSIAGAASPPSTPADLDAPFALTEDQKVWTRIKIIRADGGVSNSFLLDPFSVGS